MISENAGSALHRLVYVSRASPLMAANFSVEMAAIVALSAPRNLERGVTGMLVSHETWFVQALEGPRDVLTALCDKIALDPRHEQLAVVGLEPILEREFGAWGMRGGKAPAPDAERALTMTSLSMASLLGLLRQGFAAEDAGERGRLGALQSLAILDTLPEQQFDDLVEVAKTLTGAEIAVISLVDADRQWFKAKSGLSLCQTDRDVAFCNHAIRSPDVMWVEDARQDPRFSSNALVTGEPHVRFYAGAPLQVAGHNIGTICVISATPKAFSAPIASALAALGRTVSARLEARKDEQIAASLLSTATDAIACTNGDGKITFWNAAAEHMFGWTSAEALGRRLDIIVPQRRRAAYNEALRQLTQTGATPLAGRSLDLPALRKDGTEFPIEVALAIWGDVGHMGTGAIIRDCSERRAAERALAEAKTAAETANVAKSAFLANMSHEIRTPLNGIIGVAHLLAETQLTPRQAEMAELVRSSGAQLQGLLGDILDVARIESGQMTLMQERFSLGQLLRSTVDLVTLKAGEKGLELKLCSEPLVDTDVLGDPVRLKQILTNLLSNAVKFTDRGSVTLHAARVGSSKIRFRVTDTGIGFDPSQREHIFGRFQQADGSITRRFGGTGLGLSICRQLASLMDGEIYCDSTPGVGSTFTVVLTLPSEWPCDTDAMQEADATPEFTGRLTVLLADDHPTNRRVIELILASLDADIVSAEDGAQALELFKVQAFDLVLMDMMMPVMDGLAATRAIRRHEAQQNATRTPIIMLTANTMPEHVLEATNAGADRHVAKPITAPQLLAAIARELAADPVEESARDSAAVA